MGHTHTLDERQRYWPLTANPRLFINKQNATRISAVRADWITKRLGISAPGHPRGRILDEAQATRGDVRRLIAMFGLSVEGSQRYTATVSHQAISKFADGEDGGPKPPSPRHTRPDNEHAHP